MTIGFSLRVNINLIITSMVNHTALAEAAGEEPEPGQTVRKCQSIVPDRRHSQTNWRAGSGGSALYYLEGRSTNLPGKPVLLLRGIH